MTDKGEIKSELKNVLTKVVDSAHGYEHWADDAGQGRFAVMFRERAAERRGFAAEIRNHLQAQGEKVDDDGSLLAKGHRAFGDIRDALTGSDDESVLKEVERGETHLLHEYDDALEDIPADDPAYSLLSRQRQSVIGAMNSVKAQKSS